LEEEECEMVCEKFSKLFFRRRRRRLFFFFLLLLTFTRSVHAFIRLCSLVDFVAVARREERERERETGDQKRVCRRLRRRPF